MTIMSKKSIPQKKKVYLGGLRVASIFSSSSSKPYMLIDFFAIIIFFHIGVSFSPYADKVLETTEYLASGLIFGFSSVLALLGLNSYHMKNRFKLSSILLSPIAASSIGLILSFAITYISFYSTFGRLGLVFGTLSSLAGLVLFKLSIRSLVLKYPFNITVIGDSSITQELKEEFTNKRRIYKNCTEDLRFENPKNFVEYCKKQNIDTIIVSTEKLPTADFIDLTFEAFKKRINVISEVDFYQSAFEKIPLDEINERWLFRSGLFNRSQLYASIKRILDIILGSIGLIFAAPIMLTIAIITKITSPGPIFFYQPRMGRFSNEFMMYKFRTMHTTESKQDASGGFTKEGDSRITWIGKIIRPLHFDELPQLINIIKGDMSIVGARPEAMSFANNMKSEIPIYYLRYLERPGLTGHAQISQGYAMDTLIDTKKKLEYDLYYLIRNSVLMDLKIIVKTAFSFFIKSR